MKNVERASNCLLAIVLCMLFFFSCKKGDEPGDPPTTDTTGAMKLFEQLAFFQSTKISGAVPAGPSTTSLKKSFKDTLVLFETLQMPFKFLHEDVSKDVVGIFISIPGSPFYYDVPELADSKTNPTESVFTMGVNRVSGDVPETVEMTITPYNDARQPVARFKTKVNRKKESPIDANGFCGLPQDANHYWDWELSYTPGITDSGTITFINYPLKVWGAGGQRIKGSCCGQNTSIYGICPGADSANKSLHFNTFFDILMSSSLFRQVAISAGRPRRSPASLTCGIAIGVLVLQRRIPVPS